MQDSRLAPLVILVRTVFGQVFNANKPFPNRTKGRGILRGNRLLPFMIALIAIAVALGSLPRTQPGGSLLFNSQWLVYVAALFPIIALGVVIAMIAIMVINWRHLSDTIGYHLAKKRGANRKQSRTIQFAIWVAAWGIAGYTLAARCGGTGVLICRAPSQDSTLQNVVSSAVQGSGPTPTLPLLSTVVQFSNFVQSNWFYAAFLGFLVVTVVIIGRGIIVSWQETRTEAASQMLIPQSEGMAAVQDALRIIRSQPELDPRMRIVRCYERMILAAQQLGAMITSDQTARELEASIRRILSVKGPAIQDLTNLFEEARYSLHPITEDDASKAEKYLLDISEEMNVPSASAN